MDIFERKLRTAVLLKEIESCVYILEENKNTDVLKRCPTSEEKTASAKIYTSAWAVMFFHFFAEPKWYVL